jgi:glycogen debranching enzyme
MENWDIKDSNNRVLIVKNRGRNELHYVVSDLGTTFGKTGGQKSPMALIRSIKGSRNEPDDYVKDEFIDEIDGNVVEFDYSGKNESVMEDISIADARWIGGLLAQLSDRQLEDAFRAANYDASDVRLLAQAVRKRINELVKLQPGRATE